MSRKEGFLYLCFNMLFKVFILLALPGALFCHPFGKDANLADLPKCNTSAPSHSSNIGISLSQALISFHQKYITQIDGPRSHFRPSSSQYTFDAISKYGFFKGWALGMDRLLRENDDPWIYSKIEDERGDLYKWDPVR